MENGSLTAICWWYSGTPIGGACTNSVGYHLSVHCYWTSSNGIGTNGIGWSARSLVSDEEIHSLTFFSFHSQIVKQFYE